MVIYHFGSWGRQWCQILAIQLNAIPSLEREHKTRISLLLIIRSVPVILNSEPPFVRVIWRKEGRCSGVLTRLHPFISLSPFCSIVFWELLKDYLSGFVIVSNLNISSITRFIFFKNKLGVEPSCVSAVNMRPNLLLVRVDWDIIFPLWYTKMVFIWHDRCCERKCPNIVLRVL